jgi:hypothetical protein
MAKKITESRSRTSSTPTIDFGDFVAQPRTFYYYEAGLPTPLLAAFVERGALVCDSGLLDTRDIYPRPGYLYKVQLPAPGAANTGDARTETETARPTRDCGVGPQ